MGYTHDPASRVTQILHQLRATSTQINKADYVYNPVGNRTSLTDRRGAQAFGYDQLDRLTSASHPLLLDPQAFAYDAVGNRTTGGTVVNQGNQLTADANFAYQYDCKERGSGLVIRHSPSWRVSSVARHLPRLLRFRGIATEFSLHSLLNPVRS